VDPVRNADSPWTLSTFDDFLFLVNVKHQAYLIAHVLHHAYLIAHVHETRKKSTHMIGCKAEEIPTAMALRKRFPLLWLLLLAKRGREGERERVLKGLLLSLPPSLPLLAKELKGAGGGCRSLVIIRSKDLDLGGETSLGVESMRSNHSLTLSRTAAEACEAL